MQTATIKLLFTGKVSGDEIKFTCKREGADQAQEFTAKRMATERAGLAQSRRETDRSGRIRSRRR